MVSSPNRAGRGRNRRRPVPSELAGNEINRYDVLPSMSESDLTSLRQAIDEVDTQILALLARRIDLVLEVAAFKHQGQMAAYDPERERQVLARLESLAPASLDGRVVRRVFERIIDESRHIEQHLLSKDHD